MAGRLHFLHPEALGDQPGCVLFLAEGEQVLDVEIRTLGVFNRLAGWTENSDRATADFFEAIPALCLCRLRNSFGLIGIPVHWVTGAGRILGMMNLSSKRAGHESHNVVPGARRLNFNIKPKHFPGKLRWDTVNAQKLTTTTAVANSDENREN